MASLPRGLAPGDGGPRARSATRSRCVGLDEAYVDLSDSPAPKTRARQLKRGGAGADRPDLLDRPRPEPADRQDRLRPRQARRSLRAAPRALPRGHRRQPGADHAGRGPKTEERLASAGIRTVGRPGRRRRGTARGACSAPRAASGLRRRARGLRLERGRGRARAQVGEPRAHLPPRRGRPRGDARVDRVDGADRRRRTSASRASAAAP